MTAAALDLEALQLFERLIDASREEQDRVVEETRARDPALEQRLSALIASDRRATDYVSSRPAAPSSAAVEPPPERVGSYRLTELLGQGGMGAVWRGVRDDGQFEQTVAVKIVRPGFLAASAAAQFRIERRMLARLRHPNIAQLYDGGSDASGRAWFAMELVEGRPLTAVLADGSLRLADKLALALPLCSAVQHAHGALVVHADIKPGNVLLDREGRPKLLDFGIGRSLEEAGDAPGGHGLSAGYASPSRLRGEPPVPSDDIYALGALLWEACAGRPPETSPPPPLPHQVPTELAAVVAQATAAEGADRYETAAALEDDLRAFLETRPVRALPSSFARTAWLLVRRRPRAAFASGAAVLGIAVALIVISVLYERSESERRQADQRFAQARSMAHYMLFDLFDRLNDAPGTLPVRRELAERAKSYLDDLSAAPRAPVAVAAETAVGYMQLAGVQGLFAAGQLGERGRGRAPLERARAILDAAPAAARTDPSWLHADGRLKLFQGFAADDQGGGTSRAAALLRSAVSELQAASGRLPADPEAAIDLWQARLILADVLGGAADPRGEASISNRALEDYRSRQALYDRHTKTPLFLARTYKRIGDAQEHQGDPAGAARSYGTALTTLEAEDRRHPRRTRTLMELMDARWSLGGVLDELGRGGEAVNLYDAALAPGRARLLVEPEHDGLQRMVLLISSDRAALLSKLGRQVEALQAVHENLAARRALLAASPDDAIAWRSYLAGLLPTARVEEAAGRTAEACAHYDEAVRGFASYLKRYSTSEQMQRNEIPALREGAARCTGDARPRGRAP